MRAALTEAAEAAKDAALPRAAAADGGIAPSAIDPGSKSGPYNYTAMVNYAYAYWKNYNSAYRRFNDDCTNFISQAMRAGGWADTGGWYKDDNNWWYNWANQTWTWVNVGYWHTFANVRSHRTTLYSSPWSILPGDVLLADLFGDGPKDHSMIVTYHSGTMPYLTYHTIDTLNRSLSSMQAAYPNARWIPH